MSSEPQDQPRLEGFAATLNSRIETQSRLSRAIGFAWVCAGGAIAALLVGFGAALALVGYSQVISIKPAAEETAHALVDAIQRTKLKTVVTGRMSLNPDSKLRLASGQTVKLEEGASVKLDPDSTVKVVGDLKVDVPQPSPEQLQTQTTSESDDLPFTDYTIFRSTIFGSGKVVSGWSYDLSDTVRPRFEYCYYAQSIERGLEAKYTLAINGSAHRPSDISKVKFNFDGAFANCFWFSGF